MINPDNIFHISPTEDLQEHDLKCMFPVDGSPYCNCKCKPTYKFEEEMEVMLVIHNSFDGRENFEPDNPVRNN